MHFKLFVFGCFAKNRIAVGEKLQLQMVRLKNRYLVCQALPNISSKVQSRNSLSARDIQAKLREIIQELYGDVGLGEFGQATYVRYFDPKYSNICVVKTTREAQTKVHFALSCITVVAEINVIFRSLLIEY